MLQYIHNTFQDATLYSPKLIALQKRLKVIYDSPYTIWILLLLGCLRVGLFLLAYPPADGADGMDYYLHAAYLSGQNLPRNVASVSPLYSLFIYLNYYVLGNFGLILVLQLAMSVVQGAIFYWGLRAYSSLLAFGVALVVIGDAQTGVLYNFTSTEPLYMFLLNVSFVLLLVQAKSHSDHFLKSGDIVLGICLFAITITRTVGRFIYIPLGILFVLGTRDWRRGFVLALSYAIISLLFITAYNAGLESREQATGNDNQLSAEQKVDNVNNSMLMRPLMKGLLEAGNGPDSAQMVETLEACSRTHQERGLKCLVREMGGAQPAVRLINSAYLEMLWAKPLEYAGLIFNEFTNFLEMSGRQYYDVGTTPAGVQCQDIDASVERAMIYYTEKEWALASERGQFDVDAFRTVVQDFTNKMCPPLPDDAGIRSIVDTISLRYRSLSRPNAIIWYVALIVLVVAIPWARRLWLPMLASMAILGQHAAISALVFNVQPRYVVVTNPYKGILLLTLLFIVGRFAVRILDEWMKAKHQRSNTAIEPEPDRTEISS